MTAIHTRACIALIGGLAFAQEIFTGKRRPPQLVRPIERNYLTVIRTEDACLGVHEGVLDTV